MPLLDRLPPGVPYAGRLQLCEQRLQQDAAGQRIVENFETALLEGLLTETQFGQFCARLGEIMPDPPEPCNAAQVTDHIDTPQPHYCQGPQLPSPSGEKLSRLLELWGLLFSTMGQPPTDPEYDDALYRWQQGLVGSQYHFSMRGRRCFFWVTRTDVLPSVAASTAGRLRDLLGLQHIRQGFLIETQVVAESHMALHRPTVLDALDNPAFYPAVGPDGWGITDDLSGPRPTPGVPEAVTPMAELECTAIARGAITTTPSRF